MIFQPFAFIGKSTVTPSVPLWTPTQLGSALSLWFDADDAATISLNGSNVTQWNDKSGNSRHLSQSAASAQPALTSNQLNGKAGIVFDGSSDILTNDSVGILFLSQVTMIILMKYITGTGDDIAMAFGQTGQSNRGRIFYTPGNGVQYFAAWENDIATSFSTDVGGSHHIYEAVTIQPNDVYLLRDGVTNTTFPTSFPSIPGTVNYDSLSIGSMTGASMSGFHANISVCEIICSYGAISIPNLQNIEGYLAWKWGIQANLPIDHPYKSAPPII